jgi:hypothetical protein
MKPAANPPLANLLKELVYDEFAVLEACQTTAAADESGRAELLLQAGAAQVHVFDFDSLLRDLGAAPVTYSGCIRRSLRSFGNRDWRGAVRRLIERYQRTLRRGDLPEKIRRIVADSLSEHLAMRGVRAFAVAA